MNKKVIIVEFSLKKKQYLMIMHMQKKHKVTRILLTCSFNSVSHSFLFFVNSRGGLANHIDILTFMMFSPFMVRYPCPKELAH